jgi:hypothetical protein
MTPNEPLDNACGGQDRALFQLVAIRNSLRAGRMKKKKANAEKRGKIKRRNKMIEKLDRGVAILFPSLLYECVCAHVCARASIRPGNVFPLFCPFPFCVVALHPLLLPLYLSHSSVSFLEQINTGGK